MKKYKWGIIGTGRIASTFADAINGCPDAELYAVASRTCEKAEAFASRTGAKKFYGSYSELAQDSDIDVVYIATPMAFHYEDAMLCIENGRNVLCEKSVTLNLSQLDKLLEEAKKRGTFFMEAMWTKCRPAYLKAKEWVDSGRIGKVEYIKADFSNLVQYAPGDRLFRPECGGGALLDLTVYPLTLAIDIMGSEPEELISSAHMNKDGIDLSDSLILRWNDGRFASIDAGFEIPLRNNAVISGSSGMICFGDWFFSSCDVVLYDRELNETERYSQPNEVNGYEYEIYEVHRCLEEGMTESMLVPHSGTRSVMRIMDRCREQWGMQFPQEK